MPRRRLVRALFLLGALAVCWAIVVMWTGGVLTYVGGIRISSRAPRNVAALAVVCLVFTWALGVPGHRVQTLAAEYRWLVDRLARLVPRVPPAWLIAGIAAIGTVTVGFVEGAFVAGGSDSYGYVSQAHLWSIGRLRQEPVLRRPLATEVSLDALAPLGYRPTVDGQTIAPTYSPGLPIVMAIFERLAGRYMVFWVVPIFGGALVWLTYLFGARLYGAGLGAVAAVLVATSPPVLIQLTAAPMSDVATAVWWTLSFLLITHDRRVAALGAGAAAGAAILTRPNLVPLLAVALAFIAARLISAQRPVRELGQHVILFAMLPIPACVAIALLNRVLWGSVLQSGYGSLTDLFSLSNIWPNLLLYPRVVATLIPVALLAPVVFFTFRDAGGSVNGDRVTIVAFSAWIAVVVAVYLPFPAYDSAWNLRFLLPAIAPLLLMATVAARSLAGTRVERHTVAGVIVVAIVCGYGVHRARKSGAFATEYLQRFSAIGEYIDRELPQNAVLLAMAHSGSATYYSGRPTLRYDLLAPSRLDRVVDVLRERGYVPYLVLDSTERADFQTYYRGSSPLAALDWSPLVTMRSPSVEIYSLGTSLAPLEK